MVTQITKSWPETLSMLDRPVAETRIVISTYNRSSILSRAIESVLSQSYRDWELFIVDDNSTDKTQEVLDSYRKRDFRISIIKNPTNIGAVKSRLSYLLNSSSKYLAVLDDDDWWEKYYLENQIDYLKNYPNCPMSVTNCYKYISGSRILVDPTKFIPFPQVLPSLTVMRASLFKKLGGWDTITFPFPHHHVEADYWFQSCFFRGKSLGHINQPLVNITVTKNSMGSNRLLNIKYLELLMSKWQPVLVTDSINKKWSQFNLVLGIHKIEAGVKGGTKSILEAVRWDPLNIRNIGALVLSLNRSVFLRILKSYRKKEGVI